VDARATVIYLLRHGEVAQADVIKAGAEAAFLEQALNAAPVPASSPSARSSAWPRTSKARAWRCST
jgi:hypothetical protein